MPDLTAARDTEKGLSSYEFVVEPVVLTGATIYKGALVMFNTSGTADKASGANPKFCIGRALETVESAAAGTRIRVESGLFKWNNEGADAVEAADALGPCYVTDDNTVHQTDGGSDVIAGTVMRVDTDGVWVLTVPPVNSGVTAP